MPRSTVKKLIAVLASAVIVLTFAFVFAEFIKSSRVKRVAVNASGAKAAFSSNYLAPGDLSTNGRILYTGSADSPANRNVTICNYPQGDSSRFYDKPIDYTLTAVLMVKDSSNALVAAAAADIPEDYVVTLTLNSGTPIKLGKVSNGGSPAVYTTTLSQNYGTMHCPASSHTDIINVNFNSTAVANDHIYLAVTADLSEDYPVIQDLYGLFNAAVATKVEEPTWEGQFNEDYVLTGRGADPDELDGFNYFIAGSGSGTVTLKWRNDLLSISDYFLLKGTSSVLTPTTPDPALGSDWSYVSFHVDSNEVSRYDLQFYMAFDETVAGMSFEDWLAANFADWSSVLGTDVTDGYVICSFVKD